MVTIRPLPGSKPMSIGEGPHWIEKDQSLVYVDIAEGSIFRFFTETGRLQQMKPVDIGKGSFVSLIVPIEGTDDEFVIAVGKTLAWIKWPNCSPDYCTKKPVPICSVDQGEHNRINDGKCDPAGRLWAGTMAYETAPAVLPPEKGVLYRINSDLTASAEVSKITLSNGLAWSADRKKFFYIDSLDFSVDVFDYDDPSGTIGNRKVLLDFKKAGLEDDIPDGMCIDASGNLWVACYRGAKIICVDSVTGNILRTVEMPTLNVTSCCWGGDDYTTLYATSGHINLPKEEFQKRPDTGKAFAITGLGVKGIPPVHFKIDSAMLEKLRDRI